MSMSTNSALSYSSGYKRQLPVDRDALVKSHLAQVKFIVERIAVRLPANIDRNDLVSTGVLGLIDAANKYDPSRGVLFKTYAELRIKGAILDSLRNQNWVPRSLQHRLKDLEAAYQILEQTHGRRATEEEVAQHLDIPLAELQTLLQELNGVKLTSLDKKGDEDNPNIIDIADSSDNWPSHLYEKAEIRQHLTEAIDRLPDKERQIVALYYLEELTMKEIGLVLGLTESRVSQLHTQAVLHLRMALKSLY